MTEVKIYFKCDHESIGFCEFDGACEYRHYLIMGGVMCEKYFEEHISHWKKMQFTDSMSPKESE